MVREMGASRTMEGSSPRGIIKLASLGQKLPCLRYAPHPCCLLLCYAHPIRASEDGGVGARAHLSESVGCCSTTTTTRLVKLCCTMTAATAATAATATVRQKVCISCHARLLCRTVQVAGCSQTVVNHGTELQVVQRLAKETSHIAAEHADAWH